jgi:uncharacterized protein with HEPN domain
MKRPRNLRSIIDDMIDHIDYLSGKIRNKTLEDFRADRDIRQIVERSLEIVSEASRRVPSEFKDAHSEIPWRQVADFGNVLRHTYFHVDPEVVWEIATTHIIPLRKALISMLDELPK